jgi:general secretion pathway protein E
VNRRLTTDVVDLARAIFRQKREDPTAPRAPPDVQAEFVEFLVEHGYIDRASAERALSARTTAGEAIDTVLLELGLLPEAKLADALAAFLELERIDARNLPFELPEQNVLPHGFLKGSGLLPIEIGERHVKVATARPLDADSIRALGYFLGLKAIPVVAVASELRRHLAQLLTAESGAGADVQANGGGTIAQEEDVERLRDVAREAPIIKLLNRLIVTASDRKASDIHIEPLEDQVRVRLRIDGALQVTEILPKQMQAGLVSRVKILAKLNIAEQRLPQDGRIRIPVHGRDLDLRVSTTPTLYGESIALRILDRQELPLDFHALGYADGDVEKIRRIIAQPNGVVLITGPTGSGKTTTLYAALTALNRPESKLFTVEDPVEYHLKGVNQIHVRPQIGLDFAAVLRSILRQDPDIVMVGEIRDLETARIAVQAALTGHLVLSTLHTNSAVATVTRLIDMGVEDYLLVSVVRGIVAQRLVRRLCIKCRDPYRPSTELRKRLRIEPGDTTFFQPRGCAACNNTGYGGRTVIYEIMESNPNLNDAVLRRAPENEIEALARRQGMATLFESGLAKAAAGETSIDEVLRIVAAPVA